MMEMNTFKSMFIGDQELPLEEQELVKSMSIFKDLMKNMTMVQPNLKMSEELIENVCWLIHNNQMLKATPFCNDYFLQWFGNALRIIYIKFDGRIIVVFIDLVEGKLFLGNSANIRVITAPGRVKQ